MKVRIIATAPLGDVAQDLVGGDRDCDHPEVPGIFRDKGVAGDQGRENAPQPINDDECRDDFSNQNRKGHSTLMNGSEQLRYAAGRVAHKIHDEGCGSSHKHQRSKGQQGPGEIPDNVQNHLQY